MIVWINRVRGTRIDTEHPFHSTYDAAYNASNGATDDGAYRAEGARSLATDRRAVGNPPWNSLGLGDGRQRKHNKKGER
jgi:hypothetical protein